MNGTLQCGCGRIVYGEPCPKCDGEARAKNRVPAQSNDGEKSKAEILPKGAEIKKADGQRCRKTGRVETVKKRAQAVRRTFAGVTYRNGFFG